jgi:hypothetical protein
VVQVGVLMAVIVSTVEADATKTPPPSMKHNNPRPKTVPMSNRDLRAIDYLPRHRAAWLRPLEFD